MSNNKLKKWDNNIYEWDVTEASRNMNPWLANYGMDRFTHDAENTFTSAKHFKYIEPKRAHGYPVTAYI